MIDVKQVNRTDADFKRLIILLDFDLSERYGDFQNEYNKHNFITDEDTVVVAYYDGVAVACGCYKKFNHDTVEIKRMFVEKEYRRKGISKQILMELENRAKKEGYKKAILETGKNQPEAISLYYSTGYKKIDNYGQYKDIENSICMLKEL